MKNCSKITLAAALLLVVSPSLQAQDWAGAGRAKGVVVDAADQPIQGAKVTLRFALSPENGPNPLTTNKKGRWNILGLKPGPWLIEVEAEGYVPRKENFTVFDTGSNDTVKIDLREVPKEVKEAKKRDEANELLAEGNALIDDKKFAEARKSFETIVENHPDDGPSKLYVERCKEYEENPPPEGWDGVFRMKTK